MLRIERIRQELVDLGQQAARGQQDRHEALALAKTWLSEAGTAERLRDHLTPLLAAVDATAVRWHGCVPRTSGRIDRQRSSNEMPHTGSVLIGADGSQIYPDRHAATLYYLLHIGALVFRYDGNTPTPHTREWLRYRKEDLFDAQGYLISAETLGMERMVKEIEVLADLSALERDRAAGPLFALSDGPLLWPYAERSRRSSGQLNAYLHALQGVQQAGSIPIGYVDRPGGRSLLDLLWASRLDSEELTSRAEENPLRSHVDEALMAQVLAPGAWTTWFSRPTPTNRRHAAEGQEIWFCYANLGSQRMPAIARIEVPAWAAIRADAMRTLQAALHHQAAALDGYPYVLARAHEEALVTTQDKTLLEHAIQQELLSAGIVVQSSDKARQKLLLGRR